MDLYLKLSTVRYSLVQSKQTKVSSDVNVKIVANVYNWVIMKSINGYPQGHQEHIISGSATSDESI